MSFVQLWPIYVGVAAAALPVVVHWLTRPRPQSLPLSTLRFVREVIQQRRARSRLRDFLILALRTAAVLLLAFAVARPLLGDRESATAASSESVSRVVVLDVSQSMAASIRSVQTIERARTRAAHHLGYQTDLRANLIRAGATARPVFDQLSTNLTALRDELDRTEVLPERLNAKAALAAAGQMLAQSPTTADHRRELIVLSDFQRTNWTALDLSDIPTDTKIVLESVAPAETPANLAILRVGIGGQSTQASSNQAQSSQAQAIQSQQARLEVEIGNYSPAATPVQCQVTIGDAVYRMEGQALAGTKTVLSQPIVLQTQGWQVGEARLLANDDPLPADDVRPWVLEVREPVRHAILTRQSADVVGSSSFYLERAISPFSQANHATATSVVRVDAGQPDVEALTAADVIVIDHPGKLTGELSQMLVNLLRRGRAMLYVCAEPIDAVNLKQIETLAGSSLQMPVVFLPPEKGRPRTNLTLGELKADGAPFSVFGDALSGAIAPLRFDGSLASRHVEGGLADDLLASFSDRSAALVVSSSGAGSLGVLNVDLSRSNLPASPLFVPLVSELIERLLGNRRARAAALSGEPLAVYLPPEAGSSVGLTLAGPDDGASDAANPTSANKNLGSLSEEGAGLMWRFAAAPKPGVYRVVRDGKTVFALAVELAPEESDLRSLEPDVLTKRLAGTRRVEFHQVAAGDERADDLWTWLTVSVVVCMLVELAALRLYRN